MGVSGEVNDDRTEELVDEDAYKLGDESTCCKGSFGGGGYPCVLSSLPDAKGARAAQVAVHQLFSPCVCEEPTLMTATGTSYVRKGMSTFLTRAPCLRTSEQSSSGLGTLCSVQETLSESDTSVKKTHWREHNSRRSEVQGWLGKVWLCMSACAICPQVD